MNEGLIVLILTCIAATIMLVMRFAFGLSPLMALFAGIGTILTGIVAQSLRQR